MFAVRSIAFTSLVACAGAWFAVLPAATPAQTIDLSLNVFYSTPADINSGGTWELVAKSSGFGVAGLQALVSNIATAVDRAPSAKVNVTNDAGFNIYVDTFHAAVGTVPAYHELTIGQAPIFPLLPGREQNVFYGVGHLANGAPDWPGKPAGTNSEGPTFTSLTMPSEIPWATGDVFNNPAWSTAARLASGTFAAETTPGFVTGSSGNIFSTLGTATAFGTITTATISTIVRTNFAPSADYNRNGFVDAADYVLWRETKNQNVTPGSGADGNVNGVIDQPDYDFWRVNFGNVGAAASGGSLSTGAVPEPASGAALVLGALFVAAFRRGRRGSC